MPPRCCWTALIMVLGCEPAVVAPVKERSPDSPVEDEALVPVELAGEADTGAHETVAPTGEGGGLAAWTVMVFMNGDNELESAALGDLNEMERVGSTDAVHVLVQLDRSEGFDEGEGDWSGARRFRVEPDADARAIGSPALADLGPTDSGDPRTVVDFVAWAAERFPAERYALVLWDHGWGWSFAPDGRPALTKGISSDYATGNDISVAEGELAVLLAGAREALGQPLSLLGFDACLMASWEVAHASSGYAGVMVASQDYEDADGWPYDAVLADLVAAPETSAAGLGGLIALRFSESRDSTQSAVDLERLQQLDDALDGVAAALLEREDPGVELDAAAAASLDFEGGWGSDRDLGHLLELLEQGASSPEIEAAAVAARSALDEVVLANFTVGRGVDDANGLSIYAPTRGEVDELYLQGIWSERTRWDDLLVAARLER